MCSGDCDMTGLAFVDHLTKPSITLLTSLRDLHKHQLIATTECSQTTVVWTSLGLGLHFLLQLIVSMATVEDTAMGLISV